MEVNGQIYEQRTLSHEKESLVTGGDEAAWLQRRLGSDRKPFSLCVTSSSIFIHEITNIKSDSRSRLRNGMNAVCVAFKTTTHKLKTEKYVHICAVVDIC
jgi:hypothetical protein